ncbi:putative diphthamide synthesis protein-domain-containing protein [Limtongia smithiae]|uniref:putative diphthamide synthesis protein-domain-containing protein n=1 Tax=Limtongia smithiae TaxID=1125753 RepID=UPI0034CE1601
MSASEGAVAPPVLASEPSYAKVVGREDTKPPPREKIIAQYYLDELAQSIKSAGYTRIALQFPDNLLPRSSVIARVLEEELRQLGLSENDALVFVLGDTSYSECCVDEIAAKHVDADVVVHIGVACLNPTISCPVLYVFGDDPQVDVVALAESFRVEIPDLNTYVIISAETPCQVYIEQLRRALAEYPNVVTTIPLLSSPANTPDFKSSPAAKIIPVSLTKDSGTTHTIVSDIPHRAHPPLDRELRDYVLFHIGLPPAAAHLHLSTLFNSKPIVIDPETSRPLSAGSMPLARRYHTMLQSRAASTIGILVNTLSLRSSTELIALLKKSIADAGKKHYVIVVGKPNVAKLANFDVVDAWVIIGCPRGGMILDRYGEYYKPMVTPYELQLALKREVEWSGGEWMLEFDKVMSMKEEQPEKDDEEEDNRSDSEDVPPEFDVVTGRLVASRPLGAREQKSATKHVEIEVERSDDGAVSIRSSSSLVKGQAGELSTLHSTHYSTAAAYLQNRQFWKGLGSDFDQEDDDNVSKGSASKLEQGRSGLARGYR